MIQEDYNAITKAVQQFPKGANIQDISDAIVTQLDRRTLQRRLKALVAMGSLYAEGKTRGRRYFPVSKKRQLEKGATLNLSPEGSKIESRVTKPISQRTLLGYKPDFLISYKPNVSFYLPSTLRSKLHEIGKTRDDVAYPAGTHARRIFHRLLIDLSWNSSRLEGNTYSLLETEQLLNKGIAAEGKNSKETQMILNHKAAIEFLVDAAGEIEISRFVLLNLHALLADNLLADWSCGRLREMPVGIGQSVYTPLDIPQQITNYFEKIITTAKAILDPFEQAFFLMVQLPYLQPFEDVNKRTSRLAANIPLIKGNLCPISFTDVPQKQYINGLLGIYELNRTELLIDIFEWAYERSCFLYSTTRQIVGEPDQFRLEYRDLIIATVAEIIRHQMDKNAAMKVIQHKSQTSVVPEKALTFIETVERELQSLHEGNIARYRLRPAEFASWQAIWN